MNKFLILICFLMALAATAQELLPNGSFENNLIITNFDDNMVGYFDTTNFSCYCPTYTIYHDAGFYHFESMAYLSDGAPHAWGVFYKDCYRTGHVAQTYWDTPGANWEDAMALLDANPSAYSFVYGDGIWRQYPQEGDWFISLSSYDTLLHEGEYTIENRDPGFSMELTQPLEPGNWYELNYYIMGPFYPYSGLKVDGANPVKIGLSNDERLFGDSIHLSYLPNERDTSWILQTHCFQAQEFYDYLTIMGHIQYDTSYAVTTVFLDNFSLKPCSPCDTTELPDNPIDSNGVGLSELSSQELSLHPNPFTDELHIESDAHHLVIYDLLGQEHHRQKLNANTSPIHLNYLPVGMYLLKAYDAQGHELGVEKVLKMRH